jgi:hypothetical protein
LRMAYVAKHQQHGLRRDKSELDDIKRCEHPL